MADKTAIEWTDATWNPIAGCSIVSPACTNCYAMAMAARIEAMNAGERQGGLRMREGQLQEVPLTHYAGLTQPSKGGPVWTGKVVQAPDHILTQPLRWKKPRRIFVNSMSDLFHESVPDEWIDRIFAVMALTPQHTFQVLTKRSKRMREYLAPGMRSAEGRISSIAYLLSCRFGIAGISPVWPLPNVWIGVTTEDQTRADERIPDLLETPAAKRFVSIEPMLGPVDLTNIRPPGMSFCGAHGWSGIWKDNLIGRRWLDLVIAGGESGPNARPSHPDWFRSLRDQCAEAGVPFFFKQWGEWAPGEAISGDIQGRPERGAWFFANNWRERMVSVRESESMTFDDEPDLWRVGKRRAGSLLDGIDHKEFPQ